MLTAHPQFARATVNLIWAELMGAGIVDPPFSFDRARQDAAHPPRGSWSIQPSNPELLEALAADFRAHHFDLRYLIRLITTSGTYQISSHFDGDCRPAYEPYFARRIVRRLPPEMVADAVSQACNIFDDISIRFADNKKVKYMVRADLGTRYILIEHNGWDTHADMFNRKSRGNHYATCHELRRSLLW